MHLAIDCFLVSFRFVDFTNFAGCGPCNFTDTITFALSDGIKVFAYNLNGISAASGVLNVGSLLLGFFLVPLRLWFFYWCLVRSSDANPNGGMMQLML